MPLTVGQFIQNNRYRIDGLLGQGGMGAVYRGWDQSLDIPVAIKENLDASPQAKKQFSREANMLARLSHPNLPRVTDYFFIPDQGQYLVMDFVDGEDLSSMQHRLGKLPEPQVLNWISQICEALSYLHSQPSPIIHRDIKPANIKIRPDGRAMLVDFGIAKIYDPYLATTVGAKAITPGFSPPEQYGGGHTDTRSDVYALGATLYSLLTGKTPPESVNRMVRQEPLPPPSQYNNTISPETEQAILKSVEIATDQRFQSVEELRNALNTRPLATSPTKPVTLETVSVATATAAQEPRRVTGRDVPARSSAPTPPAAAKKSGTPAVKKTTAWIWIAVGGIIVIGLGMALAFMGFRMLRGSTTSAGRERLRLEETQTAAVRNTQQAIGQSVTATQATVLVATAVPTVQNIVPTEAPTVLPTEAPAVVPTEAPPTAEPPTVAPSAPPKSYQVAALIKGPATQMIRGVAEKDGYVFLLSTVGDLSVYDLTNFNVSPNVVQIDKPITAIKVGGNGGLLRNGNILYSFGMSRGLEVIDIQDPTQPKVLSSKFDFAIYNLTIENNVMLAPGLGGFGIYSIEKPDAPRLINFQKMASGAIYVFSAVAYQKMLYASEFDINIPKNINLHTYSFTTPLDLKELMVTPQSEDVSYHMFISDGRLVTCDTYTVALFDLSTPEKPALLDIQKADGRTCGLDRGNLITNGTVFRFDSGKFTVLTNLDVKGGGHPDGFPYDAAVTTQYVYLAQSQGVLVLAAIP